MKGKEMKKGSKKEKQKDTANKKVSEYQKENSGKPVIIPIIPPKK